MDNTDFIRSYLDEWQGSPELEHGVQRALTELCGDADFLGRATWKTDHDDEQGMIAVQAGRWLLVRVVAERNETGSGLRLYARMMGRLENLIVEESRFLFAVGVNLPAADQLDEIRLAHERLPGGFVNIDFSRDSADGRSERRNALLNALMNGG